MNTTRAKIQNHLLRFGEMPDAQKVAWLGQALVLLLQAELDRTEKDPAPVGRDRQNDPYVLPASASHGPL